MNRRILQDTSEPPVSRRLIILLAVLLILQLRADNTAEGYADGWEGTRGMRLLAKVHAEIKTRFRNPPSDRELYVAAIQGMLHRLRDPYSDYLPPSRHRYNSTMLEHSELGGIGVQVLWEPGAGARIKMLLPGSPAEQAGLQAGDLLTGIDGIPASLMERDQFLMRMQGPVGTTVQLLLSRTNGARQRITLKRTPLPQPQMLASRILPGRQKIGLLRLYLFVYGASELLAREIQRMEQSGVKGFLLDLRWNAGGAFDEGLRVADLFLPPGKIIVRVERRDPSPMAREPVRITHTAQLPALTSLPLLILINGETASSSEIVAGSLHDNNRATLLGTRSFGKARIQEVVPLGKTGGALQLTVGRYLTPRGTDIQGRGLTPDIESHLDTRENDLLLRHWFKEWYALTDPTAPPPVDPQLKKAIEELRRQMAKPKTEPDE